MGVAEIEPPAQGADCGAVGFTDPRTAWTEGTLFHPALLQSDGAHAAGRLVRAWLNRPIMSRLKAGSHRAYGW
jgi:hypothetical protein